MKGGDVIAPVNDKKLYFRTRIGLTLDMQHIGIAKILSVNFARFSPILNSAEIKGPSQIISVLVN